MDTEQIKRLCWLAWRHSSIGSNNTVEEDRETFADWWKEDAEFLIRSLPIEPKPNYDHE